MLPAKMRLGQPGQAGSVEESSQQGRSDERRRV